jgi:hypothetical protein
LELLLEFELLLLELELQHPEPGGQFFKRGLGVAVVAIVGGVGAVVGAVTLWVSPLLHQLPVCGPRINVRNLQTFLTKHF